MKGSSSLIIGLDVERFGNTQNMRARKYLKFKRPYDISSRKFYIYIEKDRHGDESLWVDIGPSTNSCVRSLMANLVKRPELNLVKKVHRYTHCNAKELSMLFEEAGMLTPKIEKAISKVTSACIPCVSNGRPNQSKNIPSNMSIKTSI